MFKKSVVFFIGCFLTLTYFGSAFADMREDASKELSSKIKLAKKWDKFRKKMGEGLYLGEAPRFGNRKLDLNTYFEGRTESRWSPKVRTQIDQAVKSAYSFYDATQFLLELLKELNSPYFKALESELKYTLWTTDFTEGVGILSLERSDTLILGLSMVYSRAEDMRRIINGIIQSFDRVVSHSCGAKLEFLARKK